MKTFEEIKAKEFLDFVNSSKITYMCGDNYNYILKNPNIQPLIKTISTIIPHSALLFSLITGEILLITVEAEFPGYHITKITKNIREVLK